MPPTLRSSNVTLRPDLGDAIVEAVIDENGLVGHFVLPFMPVATRANAYKILTREARMQQPDPAYAGHGASTRVRSEVDEDSFSCKYYSLEHELGDGDRLDFMGSYDIEEEAADLPVRLNWLRFERRVSALIFNETTFPLSGTTGLDTSVTWATAASATPIADVQAGVENLLAKNGAKPDMLIMPYANYRDCCNTAEVADRLKYDGSHKQAETDPNVLAGILGVKKILVPGAFYNANELGVAASMTSCWSTSYVSLVYSTPCDSRGFAQGPMRSRPQIGRTFLFEAFGSPYDVFEYREENNSQDVYRNRWCTDEQVFSADNGFLIKVV